MKFLYCFCAGFLLGSGLDDYSKKTVGGYYECIETLPRNQDCKLIAVPVEEK